MSSEITLLLTRGFGVQSINTSFDAEFASRQAQAGARGAARVTKSMRASHSPDPLAASPRHPTGVLERN